MRRSQSAIYFYDCSVAGSGERRRSRQEEKGEDKQVEEVDEEGGREEQEDMVKEKAGWRREKIEGRTR